MMNLMFVGIPMLIMIAVLILLGIYVYKVVQNQTSPLKIMIIGISVILFSILISMATIKIIVGILGLIIVLYGANKRDT
ncbi:hypothetical protein PMY56_07560 [Clostridium tertium]|jgi:hypothetical protein|uniref:Uncharacterized protein n=1 Tax=Clostridium tertium TaxID=1559 RepID=A0A9X4B1P1_9CLOT|nr:MULTISPECIES: hypothetical protein [Clostridium]EEH98704.1 hypothetical protein CSBG_02330 [Clostridium sp. 7_2_43FAA]MBS5305633.1 hypothetical protein [Clostridium sp.]MBU6136316.1 hypothetical protein [Clostridium tertium]MDB1923692.1 hypothetical protein [Clostridium tertium]MDB1925994.1 hypothetical protein [Clostridium tertium]